ncbi:MAG: large subunit ribosomal protein L10 [Lysobacterales bacterium]|jgi:large subunit ribosomal protein L10
MTKVGTIFRQGLVNRIKDGFENNNNVFLISYTALEGSKSNEFRMSLKKAGADIFASKNRVAQVALKELGHDTLSENISDQTAFVWTDEDSVEVAKAVVEFVKENDTVQVKGAVIDGVIVTAADVKVLSELPAKPVLQAMLLSTMQAPVSRLLGAFNAKSRDLLSILKQLSDQKGE